LIFSFIWLAIRDFFRYLYPDKFYIRMKNILFPTDFSQTAENAYVYALTMAKSLNANLIVMHSYDLPVLSSLYAGKPEKVDNVYEQIELKNFEDFKAQGEKLRKIAEDLELDSVNIRFVLEKGDLILNILEAISNENIDLLVMGTTGQSGFDKKFFGSNTVNTIKSVNIPILSIPPLAKYSKLKTIGFTTLFKESDKKPLEEILRIAQAYNAEVKCLHVTKDVSNPALLQTIDEWEKRYKNDKLRIIMTKQTMPSMEEQISKFIENNNIDMLAMVKRNQGFFQSIFSSSLSLKLSTSLTTPILILKEQK